MYYTNPWLRAENTKPAWHVRTSTTSLCISYLISSPITSHPYKWTARIFPHTPCGSSTLKVSLCLEGSLAKASDTSSWTGCIHQDGAQRQGLQVFSKSSNPTKCLSVSSHYTLFISYYCIYYILLKLSTYGSFFFQLVYISSSKTRAKSYLFLCP